MFISIGGFLRAFQRRGPISGVGFSLQQPQSGRDRERQSAAAPGLPTPHASVSSASFRYIATRSSSPDSRHQHRSVSTVTRQLQTGWRASNLRRPNARRTSRAPSPQSAFQRWPLQLIMQPLRFPSAQHSFERPHLPCPSHWPMAPQRTAAAARLACPAYRASAPGAPIRQAHREPSMMTQPTITQSPVAAAGEVRARKKKDAPPAVSEQAPFPAS